MTSMDSTVRYKPIVRLRVLVISLISRERIPKPSEEIAAHNENNIKTSIMDSISSPAASPENADTFNTSLKLLNYGTPLLLYKPLHRP